MKGNNGSAAQVTNPAAVVTNLPKKRKRDEENSSVALPQQPAAASTNPTTPPPAKRLKINGVPAVSNASAAPISSSSSSSSSARKADDLFNDAMDVDSAPNSGGNEMPASASSSSSSAEPNIKRDPVGSFSQDPLDLLSGAATYDPNAVMPEQSADLPNTPPILLSAALAGINGPVSFKENLQKVKDLVARHVSGAEVISVGSTDAQKGVFLAAIIEYATSDKATEFLINHVEDSQESNVLLVASQSIASTLSTRALDIVLQNDSAQLNKKNNFGQNLLHLAACNKDGGKMLQHIFSKLTADERKAMLAATDRLGHTPLMEAAVAGDVQGFDLLMENGQILKDIKSIHNLNLLHLAASNKDGGNMISHILSKLSAEDKKAMLAATDSKGNMPLMQAAGMGDDKGFDLLMENVQSLRDIKNNNNSNLLHLAASNKDGGKMLQHIFSKLSAEDKKAMLAARNILVTTPLMQAASFGDAKGFEALQAVTENWKQNPKTLKALVLATQKNAAFKKHFEENYPNEYKLGQGIVNMLPKARAPSAVPQQAIQQVVSAPRALQPQAQPSAGRVSPPNNQNGIQNLPTAALQTASSSPAPQFPANPLPDLSHAVERAVESLNQDLGFEDRRSSSSPSIAPLSASSGSLNAVAQSALSQTAMSSLDLLKALEQSIKNGPQTPISPEIMARLKFLEGLLMGHEAVIASQKQSNEAPSRSI